MNMNRKLDKSCLVLTGQGIGNLIMATPLLSALHSLGYRLDVWLKPTWPGSGIVLERPPIVRRVREVESFLDGDMKDYDVIVNTQWGIEIDEHNFKRKVYQCFNYPNKHEIENYMAPAYELGYEGEIPKQWVGDWPNDPPRDYSGKTIGIHSGCFGGIWEKKKWNHFRRLTTVLLVKGGYNVWNFGTDKERLPLTGPKLRYQRLDKYSDFAGSYTLPETISRMQNCDYFIANDSGLMHIADALGIPTIAIFGPTLVVKNRPVNKDSLVIQASEGWKNDCIPCQYTPNFKFCESNKCLDNVSPGFVYNEFEKLREELKGG